MQRLSILSFLEKRYLLTRKFRATFVPKLGDFHLLCTSKQCNHYDYIYTAQGFGPGTKYE